MAFLPYLPLVAGAELARRSGFLTQYPTEYLIGNLPDVIPTGFQLYAPGLVLWYDVTDRQRLAFANAVKAFNMKDKSPSKANAQQLNINKMPTYLPSTWTSSAKPVLDFR
jgi:hypothetical protein